MKLLAWDTSSKSGALAAIEWDPSSLAGRQGIRLAAEWTMNVDSQHSERLLWGLHQVLESARWKLAEIDVFGVGVGPGSFTGLRIGVTTARTLARATGKPLIGVSSLAALARPAALALARSAPRTLLIASTDACKGELFALWGASGSIVDCAAMADQETPGLWKRGVEERVLSPMELIKLARRKVARGARWMALGEGRKRYPESWAALPRAEEIETPAFSDQVQGRYVAMLAWECYQAGLARPALRVHPRYLRASDAELKLRAGLLPAGPTRGH